MRISVAIPLGLLLTALISSASSAREPISHAGAYPGTDPYATGAASSEHYFAPEDYAGPVQGCASRCSQGCNPCTGCRNSHRCCLDRLLWHGLPNPHHSPCDMPAHHAYIAEPKFYYYFRPYNWFHIPVQQDDARLVGIDPRHPYDNRIFNQVYEQLHFSAPLVEPLPPSPHAPLHRPTKFQAAAPKPAQPARAAVPSKQVSAEGKSLVRIRSVAR